MSSPSPDRHITVSPAGQRWRALFAGHVIADSDAALVLKEGDYPPVVYFPIEDVSTEYMARTDHHTHCPYKGDASYYTLRMDSRIEDNAAWSYERPLPGVDTIAGRIAFYPNKVEIYAVDDAEVNPKHRHEADLDRREIDEAVLHTDSGSGSPQREPWKPTVGTADQDGGVT